MAIAGTLGNKKIRRLARSLRVPPCYALGVMEAFWHWTRKAARTGRVDIDQWEDAVDDVGLELPAVDFRSLLVESGFIDPQRGWDWVHDWHKHADDSTRKALDRDGGKFANGAPSRGKFLQSDDIFTTFPQQAKNGRRSTDVLCRDKQPECRDKSASTFATPEPVPDPVPEPDPRARGGETRDPNDLPENQRAEYWVERLREMHPKASAQSLVEQQVVKLWQQHGADFLGVMERIEASLRRWCAHWNAEGTKFAPKLEVWLADEAWRKSPPTSARQEAPADHRHTGIGDDIPYHQPRPVESEC
jgi:hypothetical protein